MGSGLPVTLLTNGYAYSHLSQESEIGDLGNRACPSLTLYTDLRP